MRTFLLALAAVIVVAATSVAAFADEWTVTRLRGTVQQLVQGEWQPLARGDVVPDERSIFTRTDGHATLVRGNEAIELGPNTKIEIFDQGGRKPFTTILQHAGVLTVEAEVRNVQHFAVRTAYLAAVVKGTRFTVTARSNGGSVEVLRGQVSVEDLQNAETVLIVAGQKAKIVKGGGISVSGKAKAGTGKSAAAATTTKGAQAANGDLMVRGKGTTDKATKTVAKAGDKATKATEKAADKTGDLIETVVDTTTTTVDKVVDKTTKVVDKTTDTVVTVVDSATDTVDEVLDTVDRVTNTTVVTTTVNTVTDTVDTTTDVLSGLLGKKKK